MQQLIIRLGETDTSPIQWIVQNTQSNEIVASGELKNASQLTELNIYTEQSNVIALVPASSVMSTRVELPKGAGRKILKAIPFMLEEQICGDISEQFFVLGAKNDTQQQVFVVSHAKMEMWQTQLKNADIFCQQMYVDAHLLPVPEGYHQSLLQINELLLSKDASENTLCGEVTWISSLLHTPEEKSSETPPRVKAFSELTFALDEAIDVEYQYDQLPLELLASNIDNSSVNLLTGEYQVKGQSNKTWEKWRVAAILAAVALSVNLIYKSVELNQLKQQRVEIAAQIESTVKQSFPNVSTRRMTIIRTLINQEMQRLESNGGGASMLAMLSKMSDAFATTGVRPKSLRFDSSRTELRLISEAGNFESLEQFRRQVQNLGLEVEQGAFNNQGSLVVGTIVVKG